MSVRTVITSCEIQRIVFGLLVVGSLGQAFAFQDQPDRIHEFRYAIIEVPDLGGDFAVDTTINDLGHIAGYALTANQLETHPFFWDGNKTIDLGTFGGDISQALDMNNQDWVVGFSFIAEEFVDRPFLWKGEGDLIDLGDLGGKFATARGINNKNQIVGASTSADNINGHAFLWEDGVMRDLGTLNGFGNSQGYDINENGFITGWSNNPDGEQTFLWDPITEVMSSIGSLGDGHQYNESRAINDFNDIVGGSSVNDHNRKLRPYLYHDGKMHNMQRVVVEKGFFHGFSLDVNNAGQVVGFMSRNHDDPKAFGFIAQPGDGIQILSDLIPPNSGLQIDQGSAINKFGQIAATANPVGSLDFIRSVLLTPVDPELVLDAGDGPLVAGEVNELRVTGAEVGAVVTFVYGKVGGGARIPGCSDLDAMLQIDGAKTIGTAVADENGVAVIKTLINPNAAGLKGRLLQAYDATNCQESQLIQKRIE